MATTSWGQAEFLAQLRDFGPIRQALKVSKKSIRVDGERAVPIVRVLPTSTLNEVPPANDPGGPYVASAQEL